MIGSLKSVFLWIFFDWRKYGINQNDIVADFGCGDRPLPRANILVDKFLENATERPGEFIDTGAFIIQCELHMLPFKDKTIDFVYSSHVIEHLINLKDALNEMQRACRRGYITCPSALREKIMAHKMHIWLIEKKDDCLLITPKEKPYPDYINNFFDKLLASEKSYIWNNFEKNFNKEFFIKYFWENKINYKIKNKDNIAQWKIEGESEFRYKKKLSLILRKKVIIYGSKLIRFLFFRNVIEIEKILCCPICKSSLLIDDSFARCENCNKKFKHKNKRIFYFLNS